VDVDDLPREVGSRMQRLAQADEMEALLLSQERQLQAHAQVQASQEQQLADVKAQCQQELERWGQLADAYHQRLQALQAELVSSQHEAATLRLHNEQIRAFHMQQQAWEAELATVEATTEAARHDASQAHSQNAALRAHCEQLQQELVAVTGRPPASLPPQEEQRQRPQSQRAPPPLPPHVPRQPQEHRA